MTYFAEKLRSVQECHRSWLCVGLDPDPARMPPIGLTDFCIDIITATHDLACAFKLNLAFFLAHGSPGIAALEETIRAIPGDIPIILDAKLGDIGNTQRMYGRAAFEALGVDALTVSPYVGEDAVVPLLEAYPGCGLFILARTSNPDARRFQDHPRQPPYLYERVVEAAQGWARAYPRSTVGLVIGATYPEALHQIRQRVPDLPFLIPGIGTQGGELEAAVQFGPVEGGPGPLINASRAILYAGSGSDYTGAARQMALQLRDRINDLRAG